MNTINPYETPSVTETDLGQDLPKLDVGVVIISVVLLCGCVLSLIAIAVEPLGAFLMPRFGWNGLTIGSSVLIFVFYWVRIRTRNSLKRAGFMSAVVGILNLLTLIRTGTVTEVQNMFADRLPSSWFWSVATFLAIAAYFISAAQKYPLSLKEAGGEQSDKHEVAEL